ncbi:hypothetical protein GUJ93_ZPchr0005g15670 [Zizania palustris]|uniref:Uncharacterized protein n=1 Tax=Zizania palustris TaxID=103762 RepID=A0A8J5SGQ2_ZIZPA|nr:hypothetical protein GUJ93_ZPchr0005g15670 [Zizania palustris]
MLAPPVRLWYRGLRLAVVAQTAVKRRKETPFDNVIQRDKKLKLVLNMRWKEMEEEEQRLTTKKETTKTKAKTLTIEYYVLFEQMIMEILEDNKYYRAWTEKGITMNDTAANNRYVSRFIAYALCVVDETLKDANWFSSEDDKKERKDNRYVSRFIAYALCVVDEALKDANWFSSEDDKNERKVIVNYFYLYYYLFSPISLMPLSYDFQSSSLV